MISSAIVDRQSNIWTTLSRSVLFEERRVCSQPKKRTFLTDQVIFLGIVISFEGVSADLEKIRVIIEWSEPCNIIDVKSFHGLTTFYRCFILNFSAIMSSIIDYLKQEEFKWSNAVAKAFRNIKQRMMEAFVTRLSDCSKVFKIACDASMISIRGILVKRVTPLATWVKNWMMLGNGTPLSFSNFPW